MKRLIKEGLFTTLLGICVLIFTGSMLWYGKSTAAELSGWFTFAVAMLRAKDTILGIEDNK